MVALIFILILCAVGLMCAWLFFAMFAGFFVGLFELARNVWRWAHGRGWAKPAPKPQVNHARVPFEVRAAVWARDGGACVYCGETEDLTIDHVVPRVRGGSNDQSNLVTACRPCNSRKGTKLGPPPAPASHAHYLARRGIVELWRRDRERSTNGHH